MCVTAKEAKDFMELPMFRIRIILMRIRIRGSASGMIDPDPGPVLDTDRTNSNFFLLNFLCIRFKTHNDVFYVLILSLLFAYIKQN